MKLVPTMFYDPEPKPEDKEAHNEWKRRQREGYSDKKGYYAQNRLRFNGFTRTEEPGEMGVISDRLSITFEEDGPGIQLYAISQQGKCIFNLYYADGLSLQLFKDTCQENEINLQEI